jgi:hypothetical protein
MAKAKRNTRTRHPFYTALLALGCTFCETCYAYMLPGHTAHVTAFDLHTRETFPPAPVTLTAEWPMPTDVAA